MKIRLEGTPAEIADTLTAMDIAFDVVGVSGLRTDRPASAPCRVYLVIRPRVSQESSK